MGSVPDLVHFFNRDIENPCDAICSEHTYGISADKCVQEIDSASAIFEACHSLPCSTARTS
jgi:hypothetical protein